jgi:hypothetical protein
VPPNQNINEPISKVADLTKYFFGETAENGQFLPLLIENVPCRPLDVPKSRKGWQNKHSL